MTTITIRNARYNASVGTIEAVSKSNVKYRFNTQLNPCKGVITAAKVVAAGVINDTLWTVVKSQTMVLAHKCARAIVEVDGCTYREALSCALSWIMSQPDTIALIIESDDLNGAAEYVMQMVFSEEDYSDDSAVYAVFDAAAKADAAMIVEPILTEEEWHMIEAKGCEPDDVAPWSEVEGIDHFVHQIDPVYPNVLHTVPVSMVMPDVEFDEIMSLNPFDGLVVPSFVDAQEVGREVKEEVNEVEVGTGLGYLNIPRGPAPVAHYNAEQRKSMVMDVVNAIRTGNL